MINGFRLTPDSGTPVTSINWASPSTIYFTPYLHNRIMLYNGSTWSALASAEISLALSGLTGGSNYDIFVYNNAGTLTLELSAAWTDDTTRADSLTRINGVLTKTADSTRRYVGTLRASSATTTEDTTSQRFLWNYYNQVPRHLAVIDGTNTWTYVNPNSVWRQVNATTTNAFEYVSGDPMAIAVSATGMALTTGVAAANDAAVGIGIDSTTTNSAQIYGGNPNSATLYMTLYAEYRDIPGTGIGYHKINWLETGVSAALTWTFVGDNGTSVVQTGMVGEIMA